MRTTERWVVALALTFATLAVAVSLNPGASSENDTRRYHVAHTAAWVTAGNIWAVPFEYPGAFAAGAPGNGELLGAWLYLPSGEVNLMFLAPVAFAVIAALAVAVMAEAAGGEWWSGLLAGTALVVCPALWTQFHSLATDLAGAGELCAGVAFGLLTLRHPDWKPWPWMTGICLGMAVGSKYPVALPATAAALLFVALARRHMATLVALALPAAAFAGPWFARNLADFGNPLFPQAVRLAGTTIFRGNPTPLLSQSYSMLHWLLMPSREVLSIWMERFNANFWPAEVLVVVGAACAAYSLARGSASRRALAGLAGTAGIAYLLAPSGGGIQGYLQGQIASNQRYAIGALFLTVAVAAAVVPRAAAYLSVPVLAWDLMLILLRAPASRPDLVLGRVGLVATTLFALAATAAIVFGPRLPVGALSLSARPRPLTLAAACVTVAVTGTFVYLSSSRFVTHEDSDLRAALASASRPRGPVAIVDCDDAATVLGPRLDVDIVAVGEGPAGEVQTIEDAGSFDRRLAELRPVVVVVGRRVDGLAAGRPAAWRAPPEWHAAGRLGDAVIYLTGW
jgi:hypothetical protein